ncbi:MAG TPA: hypothetical protein VF331_13110 [Polyangiales bacterium]
MKVDARRASRGKLRVGACALTLAGLFGLAVTPARVCAQAEALLEAHAPTASALAEQAAQLRSDDAQLRAAAVATLSRLGFDALPALQQSWAALLQKRPAPEEVARVLSLLRRAAGSRRADDDSDLLGGVVPLLMRERSADVLAVVEPLLLLRSIEAMEDTRALLELARYVTLDAGAWDTELRLLRKRAGARALPALLALRSHESPDVRRFALASITQLGFDDPKLGLSVDDPYLLSQIVRAYGAALDFTAMPLIVHMVGDDSAQVRQAARFAVGRYGKNAIWQVRELYEEVASRSADKSWDSERSARELYAVLDHDTDAQAAAWLAQGFARQRAGDLRGMQQAWDALLAQNPQVPEREQLAPGYAALGADKLAHDDLTGALDAYRRALRLAPGAKDEKRWRAQVQYVQAELSLSHGVVDLTGYERALLLDPDHEAARKASDRLSGARGQRLRRTKQLAAAGALGLLCTLALIAVRGRKRGETVVEGATAE